MRWPRWLRPGGALRDQYDVPTYTERPLVSGVTGREALRAARLMGEAIKATSHGFQPPQPGDLSVAAFGDGRTFVKRSDESEWRQIAGDPDVGILAPVVAEQVQRAMDEPITDALIVHDPAPGLEPITTGQVAVPSFAELRARYTKPGEDRPAPPETVLPAAGTLAHQLGDVLGRPTLGARLAEQLDPETAQILVNRLHEIRDHVARTAVEQVNHDVEVAVSQHIAKIDAERVAKAREVSSERFGRRSRLS